jgi:glycosyltransferase involved in cell wall biosynthesis
MKAKYSVVVPLYNEEEVIEESYIRIKEVAEKFDDSYEIIFINDGSRDKTMLLAMNICNKDKNVKLIDFTRNFGHQNAITAGMDLSEGDAVIVIDADLQDPPEVMLKMIEKWKEGYDVVYGKRIQRKGETLFKRITAKVFYRLLTKLTEVEIPVDTGDFRLIDRRVCDALKLLNEQSRYIRGIISWLGFKQTGVEFIRENRFAGETKYPFKKMLKFAFDAITAFSYKPLKLASYGGFFVSLISFLYLAYVLAQKLILHNESLQVGWTSIVAVSLLFNGFTLIILGIIGEYIGRIYEESKNRPLYLIKNTLNFENEGFKNKLTR